VLVDQSSLGNGLDLDAVRELRRVIWGAPVVLIAPGNRREADGEWADVLRRPITVGEIAEYVTRALPDGHGAGPLDE
jgi:hypothetical protein